jgi:hypothetical protein
MPISRFATALPSFVFRVVCTKKKVFFLARLAEVLSHGKHSEQDSAWVRSDTVFRRRGSLGMIG